MAGLLLAAMVGCGDNGVGFAGGVRVDLLPVRFIDVDVTDTTATVRWQTNVPMASTLAYGTTSALGSTAGGDSLVEEHSVTLTGLTAGTPYFYRVTGLETIYIFETLGGERTRVAFVSDREDNRREIYLAYDWLENVQRVTTTGGHSPSLSPDGTRLAWVAPGAGGLDDLFYAEVDAAGVVAGTTVNATQTADRDEHEPDWLPDNSALVFAASPPDAGPQILMRTLADGTETVVFGAGTLADHPQVSPNGQRVTFISTVNTSTVQLARRPLDEDSLRVVEPGNPDRVVPAPAYRVISAANGTIDFSGSGISDRDVLIDYTSNGTQVTAERHRVARPVRELYTVGIDGNGLRRLTETLSAQLAPTWSADGRTVVFSREVGASLLLHQVPADGGAVRGITQGSHQDRGPTVSPDGSEIMFSSNRNAYNLVNLYRTDFTGIVREVNFVLGGDTQPSWSVVP